LSKDAIARRVRTGRLRRVHPGVFAVGAQPLDQHGRWYAALLACRPHPFLSHLSSAAKRGLAREVGPIHITVARRSGRSLAGVTVHRCRSIHPDDLTRIDGLPLTSLPRTLLDIAETETPARLAAVFEEADRRELLDLDALRAVAERNPGRRGLAPFLELVERYTSTPGSKEGIERAFALFLRERGLPLPEVNVLVHGVLVDCWWPEARLVVELDSRGFHGHWAARERDIGRDSGLLRQDIPTLRVTWRRLTWEPDELEADLRHLYGRRVAAGRPPASGSLRGVTATDHPDA
jgi:very-short-patch-repair endonuclease